MLENIDLVWGRIKEFPNLISLIVSCLILYITYELTSYFSLNIPIDLFEFNLINFLKVIVFYFIVVLIVDLVYYFYNIYKTLIVKTFGFNHIGVVFSLFHLLIYILFIKILKTPVEIFGLIVLNYANGYKLFDKEVEDKINSNFDISLLLNLLKTPFMIIYVVIFFGIGFFMPAYNLFEVPGILYFLNQNENIKAVELQNNINCNQVKFITSNKIICISEKSEKYCTKDKNFYKIDLSENIVQFSKPI